MIFSKQRGLLMAGDDDEMFMTRRIIVTPKTTEQHLIARSGKSVAKLTIKDSTRRFVLTDRHEVSQSYLFYFFFCFN